MDPTSANARPPTGVKGGRCHCAAFSLPPSRSRTVLAHFPRLGLQLSGKLRMPLAKDSSKSTRRVSTAEINEPDAIVRVVATSWQTIRHFERLLPLSWQPYPPLL